MQRIVITGALGMLGQDLIRALAHETVLSVDRAEMDITDRDAVRRVLDDFAPTVVINAAAYNLVDAAETPEGERIARLVNATGPDILATECASRSIRLVHVSTDYVFSGEAHEPYTEEAETRPCSVYGQTKREGEQAVLASGGDHLIVRTCRLFGRAGVGESVKHSFVDLMLSLAEKKDTLSVVNEEIASPTYTVDLAQKIVELVTTRAASGIYHVTNSGSCTWYAFAQEIFARTGKHITLVPVPASAFPRPAKRPAYSVLACTKTTPLRDWKEALQAYIEERSSIQAEEKTL